MFEKFKTAWKRLPLPLPLQDLHLETPVPLWATTRSILRRLREQKGVVHAYRREGRSTALMVYAHQLIREGRSVVVVTPSSVAAEIDRQIYRRLFGDDNPPALVVAVLKPGVFDGRDAILVDDYDELHPKSRDMLRAYPLTGAVAALGERLPRTYAPPSRRRSELNEVGRPAYA